MMTVLWIIIGVLLAIIILGILVVRAFLKGASEAVAKVFWR